MCYDGIFDKISINCPLLDTLRLFAQLICLWKKNVNIQMKKS